MQFKAEELNDRIHALLGKLPKLHRQAFELNAMETNDLAEIDQLQERPKAEIAADIDAARKTLRERLRAGER